ncbi:MAG TPA: ATP-dependent helicase, partial [Asanoa sp.]|nr:ATP-dependent helicase [Asanoa sp.]
TGVAVTFVDWDDMPRWRIIDKTLGLDMPEPPETYHTSEWLYSDLDIPTDITGTLPSAERTRAGLSAEKEEDLGGGRRRGSTAPRAERPARTRSRRRSGDTRDGAEPATSDADAAGAADTAEPVTESERRPRRRRRVGEVIPTDATDTESATVAVADGEAPAKPRSRRRRRSRGSGGTAAAASTDA